MNPAPFVPDRGDVVWLTLDPQAGHEQAGRRPVLTISPLRYNSRVGLGLFCPISNAAKGYPFEVPIPAGVGVTGVVLSDQLKSLDWRARRSVLMVQLDPDIVNEVVARILPLIDPDELLCPPETSV